MSEAWHDPWHSTCPTCGSVNRDERYHRHMEPCHHQVWRSHGHDFRWAKLRTDVEFDPIICKDPWHSTCPRCGNTKAVAGCLDSFHSVARSDSTPTCPECDPLDNKCPVYRGAASDCPDPCEEGGTDE